MECRKPDRRKFLDGSITLVSTLTLAGCVTGGSDTGDDTGPTTSAATTRVSFTAPHGATIEATSYGGGIAPSCSYHR